MARKYTKWDNELLTKAVRENVSLSGVIKQLGLKVHGGSYALAKLKIKQLGLDTSHFTGQGWCFGDKYEMLRNFNKHKTEDILVKNSTYQSTYALKNRLLKEGLLEEKCYRCGMGPEWCGSPLKLQIDHIDGDRCNNLLENLRILCPNCHSQTGTFCGKNKAKNGSVDQSAGVNTLKKCAVRVRIPPELLKKNCPNCGKEFVGNKFCSLSCFNKHSRKVERPSIDEIEIMIKSLGYCATARIFGVTDNAVRKWVKQK